MGGHTLYLYLTNCDYPSGLMITHIVYMLTLIVLFSNFYIKSYSKKTKQTSPPASTSEVANSNIEKKHQ